MVGEKDKIAIVGSGSLAAAAASVTQLDGISDASSSENRLDVLAEDASAVLPELLSAVTEAGGSITGVEVVEPNLEAVFLHLTGKALRD